MAMRAVWLMYALSIAACDAAIGEFAGIEGQSIQVNGLSFTVYQRGETAQSVRIGYNYRPNLESVAQDAIKAIEAVSGYSVKEGSLEGDAAIQRALLEC